MKRLLLALGAAGALALVGAYPAYLLSRHLFNQYFDRWGDKLVELERRGLLSKEYGAAWDDVLAGDTMLARAERLLAGDEAATGEPEGARVVDGVRVSDYPSLSIIARLNEIDSYSNSIEITDRRDRRIALIRTNHTRGRAEQFPHTLVTALLAAEDKGFRTNRLGFEFDSYVRAALRALWSSVTGMSRFTPRGTSTITQQVAKLFISDLDEEGRRMVGRTVDRKVREMRIAAALRKMYTADQILEVYLNHCVTSDHGLIGLKDIAEGLLGRELPELTDAQCVYLARMVKWGRNYYARIARQCRIDMPRMAAALGWDEGKQAEVLAAIDTLTFSRPERIETGFGHLVDCANEFWLRALDQSGHPVDLADMNIIDANSLIRKKGDLKIRLTIDLPLQRELERLVNGRGYGPDTVIHTDVRVGSEGSVIRSARQPPDTVRRLTIPDTARAFSEPGSRFIATVNAGDTLVTNVRYRKVGKGVYRRSAFHYARRPVKVDGQYYSYCIIDSRTGVLLAYYSRDRIGSRLAGLVRNRVPNGSSTAKPIFNALNFDLGVFKPTDMWTDTKPVTDEVPWQRSIYRDKNGKATGVVFANSAVRRRGYEVHNHNDVFEGCMHIFDLLSTSNNILGVETVYRLNRRLFDRSGKPTPEGFPLAQFFYRIGAFGRIRNDLRLEHVTGVRVYRELARIVGVDTDSITSSGRRVPLSDSLYSVGLGTLELTLYEQAHLYNMLYDNCLIERPASHPSLAIDKIELNGTDLGVAWRDTVKRYHPFSERDNLRPTWLGMHKRLVSNQWDGLAEYDIPCESVAPDAGDPLGPPEYDPEAFTLREPLANYAKSGTTDDVLRPFNADPASARRTNYGMWNAVVRIDMAVLAGDSTPEVRDVTIACIGECNAHYTGVRDGKTLHKFVSQGLLRKAGSKSPDGFFTRYEAYLKRATPDSVRACGGEERAVPLSPSEGD